MHSSKSERGSAGVAVRESLWAAGVGMKGPHAAEHVGVRLFVGSFAGATRQLQNIPCWVACLVECCKAEVVMATVSVHIRVRHKTHMGKRALQWQLTAAPVGAV